MYMDGVIARSLREKGCYYEVSWGVSLRHLQEMALQYGKDYDLAVNLWQNDVRECKLLATILMPVKSMTLEMARSWMEQTKTEELAEMLVYNLFQHLPFAWDIAFEWLSADRELTQLSAYNLSGRLFMRRCIPNENACKRFVTCAVEALQAEYVPIRRAAMNSVIKFSELGQSYGEMAEKAIKEKGYDFLST